MPTSKRKKTKPVKPFTWSLSRLKDFEKCPRLYHWRRSGTVKEPSSPAMERGNKMHLFMEKSVTDGIALPRSLEKFAPRVAELSRLKKIEVEKMWCFNKFWQAVPDGDADTWLRMKLDYMGFASPTRGVLVDWKSGGMYPDHHDGMRLYALGAFIRYPKLKVIDVALEYLDHNRATDAVIPRADFDDIHNEFIMRVGKLQRTRSFKPKPGKHCGYCLFNPTKGGTCDAAAKPVVFTPTVSKLAHVATPVFRLPHAKGTDTRKANRAKLSAIRGKAQRAITKAQTNNSGNT